MKNLRKIKPIKPLVIALNALLLGVAASSAQTTIIHDSFYDDQDTALPSHVPDVNLTGNPWSMSGNLSTEGYPYCVNGNASFFVETGAGISLQGYTLPSPNLTLSATLFENNIGGDDANKRGMYLGYFRGITLTTNVSTADFTGLLLDATDGSLNLLNNDSSGNSTVVSSQAYQGDWDSTQDHALSYTIDTVSGSILSATLDSQNYSFAATSVFASTNLNWAGLGASDPVGGPSRGFAANFMLTAEATPEPGTLALVGLGGVGAWVCTRRKK